MVNAVQTFVLTSAECTQHPILTDVLFSKNDYLIPNLIILSEFSVIITST